MVIVSSKVIIGCVIIHYYMSLDLKDDTDCDNAEKELNNPPGRLLKLLRSGKHTKQLNFNQEFHHIINLDAS